MNTRTPSHGSPLAEQVYQDLLQAIRLGIYAGRIRLPSESEMSSYFNVSRPVLRQALERLRAEGVINAARGSGNFVTQGQEAALGFAPLQNIPDVQKCLEFRCIVESEAAAAAALRRIPDDLANIETKMENFRALIISGEASVEADFEFHLSIAQATQSQYFVQTLKALRGQVIFGINLIQDLSTKSNATRLGQVMEEHRNIVEAIRLADPASARKAMTKHLQAGINRLFS